MKTVCQYPFTLRFLFVSIVSAAFLSVSAATGTHPMADWFLAFDKAGGEERVAIGNKILRQLYKEEFVDRDYHFDRNTHPDTLAAVVWYYGGGYFHDIQDYDRAVSYAYRALPLLMKGKDAGMQSDCMGLISIIFFRKGDYILSLRYAEEALAISRKIGDKSRISSSLNTLAAIYLASKQPQEGIRYILEAISNSEAVGDSVRIAIQYGMASELYHSIGDNVKALSYARRAYDIDKLCHREGKVAIRLSQMAEALIALGMTAEARQSLAAAIPILEKEGNRRSLGICYNQMGTLLIKQKKESAAAHYFNLALAIFSKSGNLYSESTSRYGLYQALKDTDPRLALVHLARYAELRDTLYRQDMKTALGQYNAKYRNDELEKLNENERKKRHDMLAGASVLIVVLLLFVGSLVYIIRLKSRSNALMLSLQRAREMFFTNVTHEFRTPLTVILGFSRKIAETPADAEHNAAMARAISRQGSGLLTLINQLLDISKVQTAIGNADWRRGDIIPYIRMIAEAYGEYAVSRGIAFRYHAEGNVVVMDFVPDYIKKIFQNLLSNALKFTPGGGSVSIVTRTEGSKFCIQVEDTGKGIAPEQLPHIFEPFYQGVNDSGNIGTGIGLSMVNQMVKAMDGTVRVESRPGQGSKFTILMPRRCRTKQLVKLLTEPDEMGWEEAMAIVPAKQCAACCDDEGSDSDVRILIVEDNADVATLIGTLLRGNYAVSYARDGEDGWKKAEQLLPDLIITDLMMPVMDGNALCRQIRASELLNHVPVIMLTAKSSDDDRIQGLREGADAYLVKPFNADELNVLVENLLEQRRLLREKYAKALHEGEEQEVELAAADRDFINRVVAHAAEALEQGELSVELLASKMCLTRGQLTRKVKQITGESTAGYLLRFRLDNARRLLSESPDKSIADIAFGCGFEDAANFSRVFKREFGQTPSQFRKS